MISYMFICLACFLIVEVGGTPVPLAESLESQISPEGRQGILEVPKQAATVIRNFIDRNLHSYLNIPTPVPQGNVPAELKDSIVGNLLIAGLNSWRPLPPSYTFYPQAQASEATATTVATEVANAGPTQSNVESVTINTVKPPRSSPRESQSQLPTNANTQLFAVPERTTTPQPKPTEPPTQAGSVEITTKEDEEEGSFEEEDVLIRKKKY